MNNLFSVENKVVLITGGSGGIGSALVKGFVDAGAIVGSIDKVLPSENAFNKNCYYWGENLDNIEIIKVVFDKFIRQFERIDVLINCAATTIPVNNLDYPIEVWRQTISVNLNAVFVLSKLAGLRMIKQGDGGSIINFTSINAAQAMPNNPAYATSKAGVQSLTKALALDYGKYNIRVNNLGPGYTKTSLNQKSLDDPERYKLRADSTMLGRWAEPEEMVGSAIFLASDASSYITGSDIWVDGGWLSKGILK